MYWFSYISHGSCIRLTLRNRINSYKHPNLFEADISDSSSFDSYNAQNNLSYRKVLLFHYKKCKLCKFQNFKVSPVNALKSCSTYFDFNKTYSPILNQYKSNKEKWTIENHKPHISKRLMKTIILRSNVI